MGTDLSLSPIGSLIPISGTDHRFTTPYATEAFVPAPLPRAVDLPAGAWMAVTEAMTALGRLDHAASRFPLPQLVARLASRREAIGTSALEGTFANMADLLAAEAAAQDPSIPGNVREVMNCVGAADMAHAWISERPITLGLLSGLQAVIIKGTPSDGPEAGSLRERQVFVGTKNRPISEARYVPPPPGDRLRVLVDDWLRWVNDESRRESLQLLVRVALAHYQFEAIHPYTDGNGRLGRLIIALQIQADGTLRLPALSVSAWLNDHRTEYRDQLRQLSVDGDWGRWVGFIASGVAASADDSRRRITALATLREELTEAARSALPRARLAIAMAENLVAFPILSVTAAQARHGKSNQANRDAVNRLCEAGLLEPLSESRYGRLYWNPRVFEIIES